MKHARWKNSLKHSILTLGLIIILSSFGYAQETNNTGSCSACSTTPKVLLKHVNFTHQALQIITTEGEIIAGGSRYGIYGPWQGGIYRGLLENYKPSGLIQNLVLGTIKNINRRQSSLRGTAEVLGIYSSDIITDGGLSMVSSTRPRAIIRDYDLLMDVDVNITDAIFELGNQGAQGKKLTSNQRQKLTSLFQSHKGSDKLLSDYSLDNSASTTDILRLLLRTNKKIKRSLVLGSKLSDSSQRTSHAHRSSLTISDNHIQEIINNYQCVKKNICEQNFDKFQENMKEVVENFMENGPKKSRERIKSAIKTLETRGKIIAGKKGDIATNDLDAYNQKEQDILTSRGGITPLVKRSGWDILLGSINTDKIKRSTKNAKQKINEEKEKISDNINRRISTNGDISIDLETTNSVLDIEIRKDGNIFNRNSSQKISPQQVKITLSLLEVIEDHHKNKSQQLKVSTADSQELLSQISLRLRVINDMLRNEIKTDLTRTCNIQCSNLGGFCG